MLGIAYLNSFHSFLSHYHMMTMFLIQMVHTNVIVQLVMRHVTGKFKPRIEELGGL